MESESVSTANSSVERNESPSSIVAEPTMSDSQEQLMTNENTESDEKAEKERKLRRLNRRKALAMEASPLPAPMLGRVLKSDNNTIDLTNDDDDPDTQWFKKTFNSSVVTKTKSPKEQKPFAVPHSSSKNAPRSLLIRDNLKKKLQASLAVRRRKEQEQRRKMYEEDNEHLKPPSDDEEEEEVIIKKKKKIVKPKRSNDDEYNSEDDEDYKEEDSPPENSSDDESDTEGAKKTDPTEVNGREDDELSVNFLDDSFTYDVFKEAKRSGPGSTVSTFDTRSQAGDIEKTGIIPGMGGLMGSSNDLDDILNLCSGKFDNNIKHSTRNDGGMDELLDLCSGSFNPDFVKDQGGFPDTLQMLLDDEKKRKEKPSRIVLPKTSTPDDSDNDEEENMLKKKPVKANRVLDSDEEDEIVEETPQQNSDTDPSQDPFESEVVAETVEETTEVEKTILRRVVLSGDDESDDEEEKEAQEGQEDEEEEDVDDEEEVGNEEEEEEAKADEPEPDFDDEDDELAVIKRIEHQEYKQKIKKKTFFDDEASLSGDDVGSDVEDEDGANNDYEAEEGDADDVPDNDIIRRQNHKLLLKQESDREQRALAKLQDRLLADGDLGGVETNRQFRFKLREEIDINVADGEGVEEEQEDDEVEDDEEKKKERAKIIKFKIDHAEELMMLDDPEDDNDLFKRAGQMMKPMEKIVVETSEEITIKTRIVKPSLLSKSTLAASFQEVLNGGTSAPKQMYVQKIKPSADSTDSTSSSRLSSGAVKRNRLSPDQSAAKRSRSSKLSILE